MATDPAAAYSGAIENGPPVLQRRVKMISAFSRISENVLFSVLLAAVVGWTALSLTAADAAAPAAASCPMADVGAGINHS